MVFIRVNPLRPGDAIWHHESWVNIGAGNGLSLKRNLNQCWLIPVQCRYNAIQYNICMVLQRQGQNLISGWTYKRHPIACPHERIGETTDCVITPPHCIDRTIRMKVQWNCKRNKYIFSHKNADEIFPSNSDWLIDYQVLQCASLKTGIIFWKKKPPRFSLISILDYKWVRHMIIYRYNRFCYQDYKFTGRAQGQTSIITIRLTHWGRVVHIYVNWPSLVQIMACHLVDAKPLSEPMLASWQLELWEQISVKFELKYINFHSRRCVRKCRPGNGGHFVLASILTDWGLVMHECITELGHHWCG